MSWKQNLETYPVKEKPGAAPELSCFFQTAAGLAITAVNGQILSLKLIKKEIKTFFFARHCLGAEVVPGGLTFRSTKSRKGAPFTTKQKTNTEKWMWKTCLEFKERNFQKSYHKRWISGGKEKQRCCVKNIPVQANNCAQDRARTKYDSWNFEENSKPSSGLTRLQKTRSER